MSFEELLDQISNPDQQLHVRYLYALSGMTREQLDLYRTWWPGLPVLQRRQIMRHLVDLSESSFEVNFDSIFLLAMGDEDDEVREVAVDGLWEHEDPALIEPLVYLLRTDAAPGVRSAAAIALGRFVLLGELEKIGPAAKLLAEEALRETIHRQGEEKEVRRRAVEAVAYSSEPDVREIIRSAYYSDDDKMQASALYAMGHSADTYWSRVLVPELDNTNPELRYEAARACGELELVKVVEKLGLMAFDDPDREVQEVAVWALGSIGGKDARDMLEACYESEDEVLKQYATDALDQLDLLGDDLSLSQYEDFDFDDDLGFELDHGRRG